MNNRLYTQFKSSPLSEVPSFFSPIVMNIANIAVILIIIEMFLISSVCCYVDGLYYNLEGLHQQRQ